MSVCCGCLPRRTVKNRRAPGGYLVEQPCTTWINNKVNGSSLTSRPTVSLRAIDFLAQGNTWTWAEWQLVQEGKKKTGSQGTNSHRHFLQPSAYMIGLDGAQPVGFAKFYWECFFPPICGLRRDSWRSWTTSNNRGIVKMSQVWEIPVNSPSSLAGCVLDGDQVAVCVITGEIRPAGWVWPWSRGRLRQWHLTIGFKKLGTFPASPCLLLLSEWYSVFRLQRLSCPAYAAHVWWKPSLTQDANAITRPTFKVRRCKRWVK